jgi:hypothetical protein
MANPPTPAPPPKKNKKQKQYKNKKTPKTNNGRVQRKFPRTILMCIYIQQILYIQSSNPPSQQKNENKNEKNHTHKSHKTNQVANKQILFGCIEFSQKIYIYIQQIHQNKLSSSQRSMIPL